MGEQRNAGLETSEVPTLELENMLISYSLVDMVLFYTTNEFQQPVGTAV